MAPNVNLLLFTLLSVIFIATGVRADDLDCVYTVYVRTGSIINAGTDSNMTLTLYDAAGYGIKINNLEAWGGLMGPGYNYFERTNLDFFSGRAPCLTWPPCEMNITSDGTGAHHGWYCTYVGVTMTGAEIPILPIILMDASSPLTRGQTFQFYDPDLNTINWASLNIHNSPNTLSQPPISKSFTVLESFCSCLTSSVD